MSDRKSASTYRLLLTTLDAQAIRRPECAELCCAVAATMWRHARQLDFSWCDLACDDALVNLGLATVVDAEEGEVDYHGPREGT